MKQEKRMEQEKKNVAFVSALAAAFITAFKLIVAIVTGSLGLLSEALHSALDLLASVITYFAVRISDKPASSTFNYGHAKIENFSALIETILLIITCVWIIYEAYHRLLTGETHIEISVWSYMAIGSSILIDFFRARALSRVAKKYNSQALEADALHFSSDVWSSAVVLIGLVFASYNHYFADSVAALIVAGIVLVLSYRMGRRAADVLLDKAPQDVVKQIQYILSGYPELKEYHNLKVRSAGADTFVEFNIHLDPTYSLRDAHTVCDKIEIKLQNAIPRCKVTIHPEPEDDHRMQ